MSDAYRLTFLLPETMLLIVPEGRHQPCLAGCLLIVDRGVVMIEGGARQSVFDQARRFFRAHARKLPAFIRSAVLETPRRDGGGRDNYIITVNSDVTISPGAIEPDIRSSLRVIEGERLAS